MAAEKQSNLYREYLTGHHIIIVMSAPEGSSRQDQLDILANLEALQSLEDVTLIKQRLKTMCEALSRQKGTPESWSGFSTFDASQTTLQTLSSPYAKQNVSAVSQQENDFANPGTSNPASNINFDVMTDGHEWHRGEMNSDSQHSLLDKEEKIGRGAREENSKNTLDEDNITSDPVDCDKDDSFSSVKSIQDTVNNKCSKREKESCNVSEVAIDCVLLPTVVTSGKPNPTGGKGKPTHSRKYETCTEKSSSKRNRARDKVLCDVDEHSEKVKSKMISISNPGSKKGPNAQLRNKSTETVAATIKEDQSSQESHDRSHDKLQNHTATYFEELESSGRKRSIRQRKRKVYTDFCMELFPEKEMTVCTEIKPKSLEKVLNNSRSVKQIEENSAFAKPSKCKPSPKVEETMSSQRHKMFSNSPRKEVAINKEDKELEISCKRFEEKEVEDNKDRKFKCHSCGEVFENESTILSHLFIHKPKSNCKTKHQIPFKCTQCHQHFANLKSLQKHLKKKIPCLSLEQRRERYKCKTCGHQFLAHSSLTRHITTHSDVRSVPCPKCDKKFKHKENLFKHMKLHKQKPLTCTKCLKGFDTLEKQNSHHCKAPFQCSVCLKPFRARLFLKEHEDAVHKGSKLYECKMCGKKLSHMSSLSRHMTLMHSTEKPIECKLCGKTFKVKIILNRHMKFAHSGVEYRCDICGHRCSQPDNLKRHKLRHSNEKPFMCEKCGQSYKSKRQLQVHIYLHTGEAPFQCTYCDKKYASKDTLRQHLIMHEDPKSLTCDVCGKVFGQLGHLSRHRKSHFEDEKIKCKFCELEFKSITRMMTHILRNHAEEAVKTNAVRLLKCEICGKLFVHKKDLESHVNRHTGARPYKCKYCGKDFNDRSNLRQHVRAHEGDRRFQCTICGKLFIQCRSLKLHLKHHFSKLNTVNTQDSKIISVTFADKSVTMPIDLWQTVVTNINQSKPTSSGQNQIVDQITAPTIGALQITARELNRDPDSPMSKEKMAQMLDKTNQNFIGCSESKQSHMNSMFPKQTLVNLNHGSSIMSRANETLQSKSNETVEQQKVTGFQGNKAINVEATRSALGRSLHKAIAECGINKTMVHAENSVKSVDDGECNSHREDVGRKHGDQQNTVVFNSEVDENQGLCQLNSSLTKGQILAIIDEKGQQIVGNDLTEIIRKVTENSLQQSGNIILRFEQGVFMQTEISNVSGSTSNITATAPEQHSIANSSSQIISPTYTSVSDDHSKLGVGNAFGKCDNMEDGISKTSNHTSTKLKNKT